MVTTERKPHRTSGEMFPLIERFEQSNETATQFCEQHSLLKTTFQYWLRKYRESKSPQPSEGFVPMRVRGSSSGPETGVEIVYSDGTRLCCTGAVKAEWIREVLPAFMER